MLQPAPSFDGRGEANIETGTVEVTSGPIQSLCAGWTESFPEEPSAAATKASITFNPFLKTKLMGVLATSFLRSGTSLVDGKKVGGARRLEMAKAEGYEPTGADEGEDDLDICNYLRQRGHLVIVEPSHYGKVYYDYKARLDNMPQHASKTPSHKHNMALRYMVKRFLTDYYIHARRLAGLIVAPEYSEAKLGLIHGQAKAA